MGGDARNVSPCVGLGWMGQLVAPVNEGQPLIPIREGPTPSPELALNASPIPPRLGIVPSLSDIQHRQYGVPLDHAQLPGL